MDTRVAFPVADIIRIAFVLAPFRTANQNVIIADIVRAMVMWIRESIMGGVYLQLCPQYAQVDVLFIGKEMWGHYLLTEHVFGKRAGIWAVAISRKNMVCTSFIDLVR